MIAVALSLVANGGPLQADDDLSGPRALSRAFQQAAKRATASVVTVIAYGQEDPDGEDGERSEDDWGSDDLGFDGPSYPDDGTASDSEAFDGDIDNLDSQRDHQPGGESGIDDIPHSDELLPATGLGSGVIVSSSGLIISNHHVVRGARRVVVRLHDGLEVTARDVRSDAASDIAILKIQTDEKLVAAKLGDSSQLQIGEWVLAIGSPFRLDATVSAGIISAIGRRLPAIRRGRLLQTDAAINPGNSGGPLINLDGEVVGISTAIATRSGGYQGIGFAVPINQAHWIAKDLDEHGEVRRASIGLSLAQLNARIAKQLELPMRTGILVVAVTKDRVADQAGVKPYDVILKFNGKSIVKARDLQAAIERESIGSTQVLTVFRKGEEIEISVELEAAGN